MLDGEITEEDAMGGAVKVSKSAWRKQGANQSKVDADMEARIMDGELLPDAIDDAGAPAEALTEEEMMQKIMNGGGAHGGPKRIVTAWGDDDGVAAAGEDGENGAAASIASGGFGGFEEDE